MCQNQHSQYQIVGEVYVHGLVEGEALLGTLPNHRRVVRYDDVSGQWGEAFINNETGEVQIEHPKLGPLPKGWRVDLNHDEANIAHRFVNDDTGQSTGQHPSLQPEALLDRGVDLKTFQLI